MTFETTDNLQKAVTANALLRLVQEIGVALEGVSGHTLRDAERLNRARGLVESAVGQQKEPG